MTHPSYEKAWFLEVWVDFGGARNRPKPQKVRSGPSQNAIDKTTLKFTVSSENRGNSRTSKTGVFLKEMEGF